MTDESASTTIKPHRGSLPLGLVFLGGCAAWLGFSVINAPVLEARVLGYAGDSDRDGLLDVQEEFLGTNPFNADSDGDGFTDTEEVARQSDPKRALSYPQATNGTSVGLFAIAQGESLHVASALYVETGSGMPVLDYHLGFVLDGKPVVIPTDALVRASAFRFEPLSPGKFVVMINTPLPKAIINFAGGNLGLFAATLGSDPTVASMNILDVDGVPTEIVVVDGPGGEPGGLVYRPLVTSNDLPSNYESGKSCSQETSEAGSSGSSLLLEIEGAGCSSSDGSCNGDACAASVGSTVEVVDPASLIGG